MESQATEKQNIWELPSKNWEYKLKNLGFLMRRVLQEDKILLMCAF
jgi:hypothetical protein